MEQAEPETDYQRSHHVPQQFEFSDQYHRQQQPQTVPYSHYQANNAPSSADSALSPSAIALAEAAQASQNIHSNNNLNRWHPSLLASKHNNADADANASNTDTKSSNDNDNSMMTSFLFVDHIQGGEGGDPNYDNHNNNNNNKEGRKVPINILKLPWQHPFRHHESNSNPYKIPRALFAALFLTTTLALLSAWDAQNHCITDEMDALMELFEDDDANHNNNNDNDNSDSEDSQDNDNNNNNNDQQQQGDDDVLTESAVLAVKEMCKQMFRQVMLPVGIVTGIGSLVALGILRQHQKSYGSHTNKNNNSKAATSNGSKKMIPLSAQSPPCFYSFYLPLLFVSGLILMVWTVGIILVMLRPRNNDTDNPYSSLAAVDSMGRVADNANLYYFSWISEGIAILIFYQLGGALVRQHFHPTLTRSSLPGAANNNNSTTAGAGAAGPGTASISLGTIADAPSTVSTVSNTSYIPYWRRTSSVISATADGSTIVAPKSAIQKPLVQLSQAQTPAGPTISTTTTTSPLENAALPPPSSTSHRYHANRVRWFQTFYKLRVRTGIWVAALLATLVVVASSAHIFHEVLLPAAQNLFDDDDYLAYEDHHQWWNVIQDNKSYHKVCVILASQNSNVSEELCSRTFFSLLSGFVAVILCTTAIVLHILTRQSAAADALYYEACGGVYPELALQMMAHDKHHHLPLRTELLLSFVLSLWLGWNAFLVSSVNGPAPRVGNLYYASWTSFLLCLRICLGCVEEYFDIHLDGDDHHYPHGSTPRGATPKARTRRKDGSAGDISAALYRAPDLNGAQGKSDPGKADPASSGDLKDQSTECSPSPSLEEKRKGDRLEKERAKRLRRYFFLGTFSTVCAASALDAATNQKYRLTLADYYMMLAPTVAAILSAVLFMFCLSKAAYATISQFWCGGLLSMLTFGIWLGNLVLTMHSGDSWAVNGVGEIEMANLYYFSWASIITAGLQMMSYVKDVFGPDFEEDYMVVVWAAIGKVCFVILGAAGHIWHTISDHCDLVLIQYTGAITFCSRTVLAMMFSVVGMVLSGFVVSTRLLVPVRYFSTRSRAHCEAIISIFLVLLFGVAAAMITGIGGPGQSVGDLYYSTWLAFWVSIGIFVSCYDQIKLEEMEAVSREEKLQHHREKSSEGAVLA